MEFLIDGYAVHVDEMDAHLFDGRSWRALKTKCGKIYIKWQTRENGKHRSVFLHRLIANAPQGSIVDHWDGDSLNCRRGNLRIGDHLLNARNRSKSANMTSRFKGVCWRPKEKSWRAAIRYGGRAITIGYFKCEAAAAFAYDGESMKFHGDQGKTNFLPFVR